MLQHKQKIKQIGILFPASPHFGGIWEAAVKSMKYHLPRIIGENELTYEEMSTLLTHIEEVVNSRPLHELQNTPDGLEVLTPGNFLIGRIIIKCPENKDWAAKIDGSCYRS